MIQNNTNWDLMLTSKRGWFELHLNEIWHYKDLLWIFVKRDFTTFYKQTILGPIWFFIQPLLTTIVFAFIFNRLSILDLSDLASQPMYSKKFNTAVLFNGEIFNYKEKIIFFIHNYLYH